MGELAIDACGCRKLQTMPLQMIEQSDVVWFVSWSAMRDQQYRNTLLYYHDRRRPELKLRRVPHHRGREFPN